MNPPIKQMIEEGIRTLLLRRNLVQRFNNQSLTISL
jgi:hypothetical protein